MREWWTEFQHGIPPPETMFHSTVPLILTSETTDTDSQTTF